MSQVLELRFRNQESRMSTISVNEPDEELETSQVENVMDQILDHNVFFTAGGSLAEKVDARFVSRTVDTIYEA
ncbi:hypothetical protein HNR44_002699 [Geomicrobium halophilum]|uniref:DUF2922 domain-containing protein n=1 Tax=Geomicrobium halophilum TaxID=549000 RepID=A0A841PPN8_9BACL|nr:DUF2922 domain-containing protein [Geomicrobium halophilum]MBB6450709.1 hypothetical protein [Geomicrobium halophilum]